MDKFEYLGEWIQTNGCDKEVGRGRVRKLESVHRLT